MLSEPGANGQLQMDIQIDKGFFVYENRISLKAKPKSENIRIQLGDLRLSPILEFVDPVSKKKTKGISEKAQLTVAYEFDYESTDLPAAIDFEFKYQACTKTVCLFPVTETISVPLRVQSAGVSKAFLQASRSNSNLDRAGELENQSWFESLFLDFSELDQQGELPTSLWFFVFVFLAGVLTSFTPCIFPMIPITVSILGVSSTSETVSFGRRLFRSLSYVFGIATTYTGLGILAALSGSLFGSLLAHPVFNLVLFLIFFTMSLFMLEVFHFPQIRGVEKITPKWLQSSGNLFGAYVSGLVAGTVASPCVGPILFSLLALIAKTQDVYTGGMALFVFALGLGQIFILIGLSAHTLKLLPRSGSWLLLVNAIFGLTMGLVAFYYLQFAIPKSLSLLGAGLFFVIYSFWSGSLLPTAGPAKKILGIATLCLGLLGLIWSQVESPNKDLKPLTWYSLNAQTFSLAQEQNKPMLVDFYADWCAACIEFEEITFQADQVYKLLSEEFILVRVDATRLTPEIERIQKEYKVLSLPTLIFLGPNGAELLKSRVNGFEGADQFLGRLESILALRGPPAPGNKLRKD